MKTGCLYSRGQDGPPLLRSVLLYGHPSIYYASIILDLIMRYLWVVSLAPSLPLLIMKPTLSLFLGSIEIMRRGMWGILRVENEHIKLAIENELLGKRPTSPNNVQAKVRSLSVAHGLNELTGNVADSTMPIGLNKKMPFSVLSPLHENYSEP